MNKRGSGEEIMFFGFFVILALIILGIVWGVAAMNARKYDFRLVEAQLLADHVLPCFKEKDFFRGEFNFFDECKVNENMFDSHLIHVENVNSGEVFFVGVLDYINQCEISGNNRNFPQCVTFITNSGGNQFRFTAGANQKSARGIIQ